MEEEEPGRFAEHVTVYGCDLYVAADESLHHRIHLVCHKDEIAGCSCLVTDSLHVDCGRSPEIGRNCHPLLLYLFPTRKTELDQITLFLAGPGKDCLDF